MIHDQDSHKKLLQVQLQNNIFKNKKLLKKYPQCKNFLVEHPVTVTRVWYIKEKLLFEFKFEFEDSWLPHVFPR
jgi:hypothetical protein